MKNLSHEKYTSPLAIVLFGGTGDLARAKLLPAFVDLYIAHGLPDTFTLIGLSRKEMSDQEYREFVRLTVPVTDTRSEKDIHMFCEHVHYLSGNFDERPTYDRIKEKVQAFDIKIGACSSKLLYLAVPPDFYSHIFSLLKESGVADLVDEHSWVRLLIEKPFGRDLESATVLDKQLRSLFADDQIYCVDHYLEKEAIESIVPIRFDTPVFSDIWNAEHIESITIRLLEKGDVSVRGAFYDKNGALRDVGQNHMLQMLALLTMDKPKKTDAQTMHKLRSEAVGYFSQQLPQTIIRGQYNGFIGTLGVAEHSQTETYFKIGITPPSDAWHNVAITLESGKALRENLTDATIVFRQGQSKHTNTLHMVFSPLPSAIYTTWIKKSDSDEYESKDIEIPMLDAQLPEGYERVIFDCIIGDQSRFVSGPEILVAWELITPVLEAFKNTPLVPYEKGSAGPLAQY